VSKDVGLTGLARRFGVFVSLASQAQPSRAFAVSPDLDRVASRDCLHCGTPLDGEAGEPFCCAGCSFVYALIHAENLERYYSLRGKRGVPLFGLFERARDTKWLEPIEAKLAESEGTTRIDLDIQGLHCTGCVYLIDAVFKKEEGAVQAVVNPALGKVQLGVKSGFSLRSFVEKIERFGYRLGPPAKRDGQARRTSDLLVRMGVAIAIAMNSMIFAVSGYAGLTEGGLAQLFFAINFGLCLVSVVVGGAVFFRSAWQGLRRGVLHFDLPIALGIVAAFSGSVWSFFERGSSSSYFDTVNVFIALMLVGRFLQERVLERNRRYLLSGDGTESLLSRRIDEKSGKVGVVPCSSIEEGDRLLIAPGDLVPVAGQLEGESASFSLDWINGESRPSRFEPNGIVPAGAFLAGTRAVTVRATEAFSASPLVELLRSPLARDEDGPRTGRFWQLLAKWYVVAVLFLAAAGFVITWLRMHDVGASLDVVTAVLVVTCPCAFGIATPLAYELVQNGLRKIGLFVRSPGFLDRATSVRRIVFDKTGTLTTGTLQLADCAPLDALGEEDRATLFNLAARSHHPKSQAVIRALGEDFVFDESLSVIEHPGRGLSAVRNGREYRLGAPGWANATTDVHGDLVFSVDGEALAVFTTTEELRRDAREEIAKLKRDGYEVWILSGDREERVRALAEGCGIELSHAKGERGPKEKEAFLREIDRADTLMIGDGINDSLVVAAAHTSGTPAIDRPFMAARSDFYFVTPGLRPIRLALEASRRLHEVIRRNLTIAIAYNLVAISLAYAGLMSPLLATIFMPISSISILLATIASLSGRRAPWKS